MKTNMKTTMKTMMKTKMEINMKTNMTTRMTTTMKTQMKLHFRTVLFLCLSNRLRFYSNGLRIIKIVPTPTKKRRKHLLRKVVSLQYK